MLFACGPSGPIANGFYRGEQISFQVMDVTEVTEMRVSGIECRVPFEPNPLLSICKHTAPGFLWGNFAIDGAEFTASSEGLVITGVFDGETVTGTWRFSRGCIDGSVCEASGTWSAEHEYTVAPPTPDVGDTSDGVIEDSVGPQPDIGPDAMRRLEGIPDPPENATPQQVKVNNYLNTIRQQVGVAMAIQVEPLNQAAQAHADYYGRYADEYKKSGLSPHQQNPDWTDGYTGTSVGDRCSHAGFDGGWLWEVMAFMSDPHGSIDGWMDTLYHRVPLIHPNTESYGYGISLQGAACDVIDGNYGKALLPGPARWPLPNTTNVAVKWMGWESPQPPLPADQSYPSGPVITITFPRSTPMKLTSAVLLDPSGEEVPAQVQTPENDSWLSTTWAIYAYNPLMGQSTYTVRFEGTVQGAPYTDTWSFTTQ